MEAEGEGMERVSSGRERGAGLRVVRNGVTRFAATVDLSPETLLELARYLAAGPDPGDAVSVPDLVKQPSGRLAMLEDPSLLLLKTKGRMVLTALHTARKFDRRIVQARSIYRETVSRIVVANSLGILAEDTRAHGIFMVQVVASDGEHLQVGYEPRGGIGGFEVFRGLDPEEISLVAAGRAISSLDAPEAPSGRMTVVLSSEAGGTMVHEAVGHGLEADLSDQGLSVYSDMLGEQVAGPLITVVDDPTIPGRRGSYNIDDEGLPGERKVLVENGVLKTYMNDLSTARRAGVPPTGNGRRESYRHWPIPRMSNTIILPGKDEPDAIVRSVDRGLFVKKMGGGQVNTVTGDFVFEVSEGYLIEGGMVAEPVRGATLAGNGPEVLKSVDMVGSDLGFGLGTCGKEGQGVPVGDAQPTLRIPDIVVGGRDSGGTSG
ncbi:MAG TPA: TldD/PmbA family protein [Proteobacteria bacterium]|nr:TldD/PmbA family protein [Pseudomonadota bacterium]